MWTYLRSVLASLRCGVYHGMAMSFKWVHLFQRLDRIEKRIVMNQTELAAYLTAAAAAATATVAKVDKVGAETAVLLEKMAALQDAVNQAGNTTPEVDAALAALNIAVGNLDNAVQAVDDQVPDIPV